MNSITIAGVIGRDAGVIQTKNGDPLCRFTMADRQGKDKDPIWWSIGFFGKRATTMAPYLIQGMHITVVGFVTETQWIDKNGDTKKGMQIRATDITLQGFPKRSRDDKPMETPFPKDQLPENDPKKTLMEEDGLEDVPF